jgi:hypothetical protein
MSNSLEIIKKSFLSSNFKLEIFNISNNLIRLVEPDSLSATNFKTIDFGQNNLSKLHSNSFASDLVHLKYVSLDNNQLSVANTKFSILEKFS